jgi:hypothetical protein
MEWWNDGILVFKRILTILILSSIPPVAGPLISPRRRRYPYEPEANISLSQNPLLQYSSIPAFQLGRSPYVPSNKLVSISNIVHLRGNINFL